jgi:hypothetical protein
MADAVTARRRKIHVTNERLGAAEIEFNPGEIEALRRFEELPPTTIRCAVCKRATSRHLTADGAGKTRGAADIHPDECPEHGELQALTFREWYAEWTRKGKPDPLTIHRPPVS